ESGIVKTIIKIAETSSVVGLRGTSFYVIGLIASCSEGVTALLQFNYESVLSPFGQVTGLCIPKDTSPLLTLPNRDLLEELDRVRTPTPDIPMPSKFDNVDETIIIQCGNMCSHLVANEASRNLFRLRGRYPEKFKSKELFE